MIATIHGAHTGRWARSLATLTLSLVAVVGCSSGGTSTKQFSAADVDRLNLQGSDLPSGFVAEGGGDSTDCVADNSPGGQGLAPLGVIECGVASFKRSGASSSNEMAGVVWVFPDAASATKGLQVIRADFATGRMNTGDTVGVPAKDVSVSGLGDEAPPGVEFRVDPLREIFYVWRTGNVVATVGGGEIEPDTGFTLEAAKKMASRASD